MSREYKCLNEPIENWDNFKIVPILDSDKLIIMQWRNGQIDILRQNKLLTEQEQELYFANVVNKLFEEDYPNQLLFGFYEDNILIGYGGLVHINWVDKNAEISFLTETSRNKDVQIFKNDWSVYLKLIEKIAFDQLNMIKIYTYSYDIRPHLVEVLTYSGYLLEARLKKHISIQNKLVDILIHSKFNNGINF
jgi:hypothetical protein